MAADLWSNLLGDYEQRATGLSADGRLMFRARRNNSLQERMSSLSGNQKTYKGASQETEKGGKKEAQGKRGDKGRKDLGKGGKHRGAFDFRKSRIAPQATQCILRTKRRFLKKTG